MIKVNKIKGMDSRTMENITTATNYCTCANSVSQQHSDNNKEEC